MADKKLNNWVVLPGAIFSTMDQLNDLSEEAFDRMVSGERGQKASINLSDVFCFDGCGKTTMLFINRLNPIYALLDIPMDKFVEVFFSDEDKENS